VTQISTSNRDVRPAWSADGSRLAFFSGRDGGNAIYRMNADGGALTLVPSNASSDGDPGWSPDGTRIVFAGVADAKAGINEVYVVGADGSGLTRLTNNRDRARDPAWSPDATKIAFASDANGRVERGVIHVMNADGSGQVALTAATLNYQPDWSPDGASIVFTSFRDGQQAIFRMNADGSGQTRLTDASFANDGPVWSPDGTKIAFRSYRDGHGEIYVMNADGSAQTRLTDTESHNVVDEPSWQPLPKTPVIFIHGFLGSRIYCGTEELWPNIPPLPRLPKMLLKSDGKTNATCPSAGPKDGDLLLTTAGSDVYQSTVDFLTGPAAPGVGYMYAWDWRKNPSEALDGLDALVERVRRKPDGKVVLMAHSMGGLVTRLYVEDPARAAKVARALTVATPYWGSPKALFPFLYGVEAPGASALDVFFPNADLKAFARYLQGMFFLWPSARYGGWLSIEGRASPLNQTALLDLVDEGGGNRSLLATALGAHAQHIDELRTNGVDYQTVVGSGVHTIGSVSIESPLGVGGLVGAFVAERDIVRVEWVDGDGTVPLKSALAATPQARRHFTCGISHVPLPGNAALDARVRAFLADGKAIEDPGTLTQRRCDPEGTAISVFSLASSGFASSAARVRAAAGAPLSLDEAERRGLIEVLNTGHQIEAATSTTAPLSLTLKTGAAIIRIARLKNGRRGTAHVFGPTTAGALRLELGPKPTVRVGSKRVAARADDRRPPVTKVKVTVRGRTATLRFTVSDASPTTTYVIVAKRLRRVTRGRLTLSAAALRRGIQVHSIDKLGNAERPKPIRRR
jgi:pimeloyl-ACP methyl ester carboxylesterase